MRTAFRAPSTRTVCSPYPCSIFPFPHHYYSRPRPLTRGSPQPCAPSPCPVEGWQEGQPCCRRGRRSQGGRCAGSISVLLTRLVSHIPLLSMSPCNAHMTCLTCVLSTRLSTTATRPRRHALQMGTSSSSYICVVHDKTLLRGSLHEMPMTSDACTCSDKDTAEPVHERLMKSICVLLDRRVDMESIGN